MSKNACAKQTAVKNSFSTYVCYAPDGLFWLNLYLASFVFDLQAIRVIPVRWDDRILMNISLLGCSYAKEKSSFSSLLLNSRGKVFKNGKIFHKDKMFKNAKTVLNSSCSKIAKV